ncbi:family 78 glycoside hydrolase catalytic domain [Metabacillus halosaccharovorans]|uniref:alpha-L-rhamnosidase-related protein n=1 Tax=Metabacillus halosaccharovorans TaxID=930124 RepID=UPI0009954182|nr:family 78 glycoside hydrolase catalytic domain [Metabacillus halosaccharovorans]
MTAHIQKVENQVIDRNEKFISTAENLKPEFVKDTVTPTNIVKIEENSAKIHGWEPKVIESADNLSSYDYGKGDEVILDFGTHLVGYLSMNIIPVGSPPDAPLHLKVTFGEMPVEMAVPFSEYNGWISSSWLQEETLHIDVMPGILELPRRYSFRYVKIEVLDTSKKYRVAFENLQCETVTSADVNRVTEIHQFDPVLDQIDKVSIKTLQDCMQEVFEDGPKRDRRLWLGDLRLQALANYETFQTNDLVKRCLYLFAGVPDNKGRISANLFIAPSLIPDDTYLFDYSLLFTTTLFDYYEATKDTNTLAELWPLAYRQVELALERLDDKGIVIDDESWWSFIDWHEDLNKQAPSQAILIYTIRRTIELAKVMNSDKQLFLEEQLQRIVKATITHLWDNDKGFFVSGAKHQVSWASQIWMAHAEVLEPDANRKLILHLLSEKPDIGLTTPYMYHYLVEALILVGEKKKAVAQLKAYWGEMIKDGADTFWELYDPDNKDFSPYGSYLINSYCHAWSCTPTYLIRKYQL